MDIDKGPFNIFSIWGIVWVKLMGNTIAIKVMLLTPAFRNMDAALEEAGRVSGASNLRTALRITLPLMISPLALVFGLQLLRVFQSFGQIASRNTVQFLRPIDEIIWCEGRRAPTTGSAALAGITLLVIALIIPVQR
jgi:ABC-type Fe3+ transport system permease subunit